MVYLGPGFSRKRLYSAKSFIKNTSVDELVGSGIKPEHINYDALGKALDAIHAYRSRRFFSDVALTTLIENNLMTKFYWMDSTSHNLFGRKYGKGGKPKVCSGHSKGRKDLPQLVQHLVTTDNGLPFWSETFTGSESDREIFQSSIAGFQKYFGEIGFASNMTVIADSALYSKRFLLNKEITGHWITRVPESIGKARKFVEAEEKASSLKLDGGIKFTEEHVKHGGKLQRWIIVTLRASKHMCS